MSTKVVKGDSFVLSSKEGAHKLSFARVSNDESQEKTDALKHVPDSDEPLQEDEMLLTEGGLNDQLFGSDVDQE